MRRLFDPYGTLGATWFRLCVCLLCLCLVAVAYFGLAFVLPARFTTPVIVLASFGFSKPLVWALGSLPLGGRSGFVWSRNALVLLAAFMALFAGVFVLDWPSSHMSDHLGFSRPLAYQVPPLRDLLWFCA